MTGRIAAAVLLLLGTVCAQIQTGPSEVVRILRVRVAFGNHAPCDSTTHVALAGVMGLALPESPVNGECMAEFFDVPAGRYRVTVKGNDAENADSGEVDIDPLSMQEVEVRARYRDASDPAHMTAASLFVSVRDLRAPSNAMKEFEKAERLIAKQAWPKALERLHKGLAIYPDAASAYNNLGAIYSHMGDTSDARVALRKAIALDDHLAPAYVNLGRLSFLDQDYPGAESLLGKATGLEPAVNADELFLLAYAQFADDHLNQAIGTSLRAHAARMNHHALLHLVAASAYEKQNRIGDSISELELYLNEEPTGARSEKARGALATLQAWARVP